MLDIEFPTKNELEEEIRVTGLEHERHLNDILSKIVEDYKKDLKSGLSKKSNFGFCIYESTRCNRLLMTIDSELGTLENLFDRFLKEKGYIHFKVEILKHIAPVERPADPYYELKFIRRLTR